MNKSKVYYNGSKWVQSCGNSVEVLDKLKGNNYLVKFEDSPPFSAQPKEIKTGAIKNRNIFSVLGVGRIGYGEFPAKVGSKNTKAYDAWRGILRRCYDPAFKCYPRYGGRGITMEKGWLCFQSFAKWYYESFADKPTHLTSFDIDKDLRGGMSYSEHNCTLLPYKLNNFIQVQDSMVGDMGYVKNYRNPYNRITTTISLLGKQIYIHAFLSQAEANEYYDIAKRYVSTLVADKYLELGLISDEVCTLIKTRYGSTTQEEVTKLLSVSASFKKRLHGVVDNESNLLCRVKGKVNSEIYK
ncbi:hypothetical protein NVP1193O_095 [Vibrio phage 1.193.O._10N.286.52.C6]|nr:hypothetical protein NVP1193O_095 [Vibrio phage 1.193.O._10N.286.52.C6]